MLERMLNNLQENKPGIRVFEFMLYNYITAQEQKRV